MDFVYLVEFAVNATTSINTILIASATTVAGRFY